MKKTLVINDLHLGVQRTGGTTLASAADLRQFTKNYYQNLLDLATENQVERLLVNGDLTDVYDIPLGEALDIYVATADWMDANPDIEVVWALGNHDLSKDSMKLGSVAFIGALLSLKFPGRFVLARAPTNLGDGAYVIPHMVNQEIFEYELGRVPDGTQYLFLHCNFDNPFAGAQDHSLNITRDQAKVLRQRDIKIVLGHEHQGRTLMNGNLIVVGNQFPTSVSDCLSHGDAQRDGKKYALLIQADGTNERVATWSEDIEPNGWFAEVDWRDLEGTTEDGMGFIRVTGDATKAESAAAVKAVAKFRQRSRSFVVTNAVRVEAVEGMGDLADTAEDIRSVNVIEMLLEMLNPEEQKVVKQLIGEQA